LNFIPPSDRGISEGQRDGLTTRCLSLATLAKLADCFPYATVATDRHGEIIWVNAQTEKMFGYTRDNLLGQSVGFLVPDRSREILLAQHRAYSAEPRMPRMGDGMGLNGRRKDGTEFPIDIILSPIETNEKHAIVLTIIRDISKRNGTENALRESEDRFRTILDHSPNLIFLKDVEGRYLFVNKEFQRVFHLSQEQIDGKKDEEVFPAAQAAAFRTNDLHVLHTGVSMEFEEVALHEDGPHTSIVHKFPLRNPEGKIYATGGIVTDFTERKRAQAESLALQEELASELTAMVQLHEFSARLLASTGLQQILEDVLSAIISLQSADFGNVQLYNPETHALEIVAQRGFRQDFLDYFNSVHEDGAACGRALQRLERVIIEDVQHDPGFEPHRQIAASAGFRAVQSTPLFSRSGEPLGMISTHFRQTHRPSERDLRLTDLYARQAAEMIERRRAEEALRKSEERFRLSIEGIKDYALIMLDPDGRVIGWNTGAERIKGYHPQEILGQHFSRFYEPGDVQLGKPELGLKVAAATSRFEEEGWRIRKDGSRFWANVVITTLKDETGKLQGFVKVTRDMTERKRAEEALKKAFEEIKLLKDQLAQEKLYLEEEIRTEQGFEDIIGQSKALRTVLRSIEKVAPTDSSVLIQGETGAGKELIARAIHNLSPRRDRTFIKLNCAAIPLGLLESELFGHEKGAFTGAIARKVGRFELAHGGTLFLDEVGDIPLELQPKLLRVLQDQEFERLGSTRTQRVDVRLVAATNRDVAQMVAANQFRSDLYYRLNVFPIRVPPLRERPEDIPLLVRHFTSMYARRMKKQIDTIPGDVMEALTRYRWPGNVRELQNLIERAVILSPGPVLHPPLGELAVPSDVSTATTRTLKDAERDHILRALDDTNWVIGGPKGAAALLGLKRTTLRYKMERLDIQRRSR
jgi:PAS domain S-box-containing protein